MADDAAAVGRASGRTDLDFVAHPGMGCSLESINAKRGTEAPALFHTHDRRQVERVPNHH